MIKIILIMSALIAIGVFITLNGNKSQSAKRAEEKKFYTKAHKILSSIFITQKQIQTISSKLSALSIYSKHEIQELSIKYFIKTTGISVAIAVAALILFNDTISKIICIIFALLVNNALLNKQVEKNEYKVYKAFKEALSSVRQEYLKLGSVAEALAESDIPPILSRPFTDIYNILTGAESELMLLRFYEATPFRPLQTFAAICYNVHNYGDGKDEYGQSNFIQSLTTLTSDINSEIQRLVTMKTKFGKIEYLTFVPVFATKFIESYFMDIMPGTALIYNGLIGYLGRAVTLVCCIISYSIVSSINTASALKEDDRIGFIKKLAMNKKIADIAKTITPKNKNGRKLSKKLDNALSRKTPDLFYIEKLVWSSVALCASLLIVISTVTLSRAYIVNSTQQLSLVASDEMKGYTKDQILALDNSYFNRDHEWSNKEFETNISAAMPGLTTLQIQEQIKRLQDKEKSLNASYFHWYYIIICIAIACLAWRGPDLLLYIRRYLVKTETEDDFLSIQTLTAIIMNSEMDTLDALWQMCQHSKVHKNMLLNCYHGYPSNPEKELSRLQSKTPLIDFKRFIGKLKLTINDLSLREAFSDLKIEREHILRLREIAMYAAIDKRRGICGPISLVPLGACVLSELIIPLGYLGFREFMNALSSLG